MTKLFRSPSVGATMLSLVAFSALALSCAQHDTPGQYGFDFFLFVRQYHPSHCASHECFHKAQYDTRFTVHGLWPEYSDGGWPQFCQPDAQFDETAVQDLLPQLQTEWPSWTPDNKEFWQHEWLKHGTCAAGLLGYTQHEYFARALDMHRKYNIEEALAGAGITASNTEYYDVRRVEQALVDAYGSRPIVHCDENGVSEIWLCARKEDLKLFDCTFQDNKCTHVKIPLPKAREGTHGDQLHGIHS